MEVVLVQLAHKTREIAVLEVFGEDGFGELLVLPAGQVSISSTSLPRLPGS
jgi:hypothetical protein